MPQREGYLLIDHRGSPGLTPEQAAAQVRSFRGAPIGEGQYLEVPTLTCRHCATVSVKNPLRTRERCHCSKCNHYICDGCGAAFQATGICRPFTQVVEEAATGKTPGPLLAKQLLTS